MERIYRIYDKLPGKRFIKKIAWHIPTPYLSSRTFREYYSFLTKSQWWSKEDLQAYQFKQLIGLLEYAKAKVPYYRKLFQRHNIEPSKFKSLEDIQRIPFLTKEMVREHFEELQSEEKERLQPIVHHTGGSSGSSLKFISSLSAEWIRKAAKWRANNWAGYNFGDKALMFIRPYLGVSDARYSNDKNYIDKQINLNITQFNAESLSFLMREIEEHKPKIIESYPSRLFIMSKFLKKSGISLPSVEIVITSSETLYRPQREKIENLLKSRIFDEYGQAEFTVYAAQCEKGSYHLSDELHLVEIIKNSEGKGLKGDVGEVGEVVGTSLVNYAMPLIRYKTGDLAVRDEEYECPCGRALPVIRQIVGRANDIIVTRGGAITFPHSLFEFHLLKGVDDLQIIQENLDFLRVKVVINEAYNERTKLMLINMLREKLNHLFEISVEPVEEIPRTLLDKHRLVVSKISN